MHSSSIYYSRLMLRDCELRIDGFLRIDVASARCLIGRGLVC